VPNLLIETVEDGRSNTLRVTITNESSKVVQIMVKDAYTGKSSNETIPAGRSISQDWNLASNHNWYDLTVQADGGFLQQLAGHIENGEDSYTDPAMGDPA
jgi:phospholipase C